MSDDKPTEVRPYMHESYLDELAGAYPTAWALIKWQDAKIERLEEALSRIAQWADAYPTEIFPEVDAEYHSRARRALEAEGLTLDRLSASAMRHVVQGVGKIARDALNAESQEAK